MFQVLQGWKQIFFILTVSSSSYIFTPLLENLRVTGRLLLHLWLNTANVWYQILYSPYNRYQWAGVSLTLRALSWVCRSSIWSSKQRSSTGKEPTYFTAANTKFRPNTNSHSHQGHFKYELRVTSADRVTVPSSLPGASPMTAALHTGTQSSQKTTEPRCVTVLSAAAEEDLWFNTQASYVRLVR